MRKFSTAALLALLFAVIPVLAQDEPADAPADDSAQVAQFIQSLHFQSGTVALPEAKATLKLQGDMRFLPGPDAERVLTELWGNPPGNAPIGMLVPSVTALTDENTYAVVVTYNDEGYVSDKEAASIDYDKMLKDMQAETRDGNDERSKAGYGTVELVGWASKPHYDASSNKIIWAKELKFSQGDHNTVNYDVRVLGRSGYLSLNAVANMDQLHAIEAQMPQVIALTEFDEGARYADYKAGTDKLATYGLAALVAGGVAAKAGLFGKLAALLIAGKKLVAVLLVGLAAGAKKIMGFFKRERA
jgi:uncharacterized membrane-anchored protein